MAAIVVPFRGSGAKLRLAPLAEGPRAELALAMLGDVLAACVAFGETRVVTADAGAGALAEELGAALVDDPGGGQGAAVGAALAATEGAAIVVNADVPCVVPHDLRTLVGATPVPGIALVAAQDGTTNALALSSAELFAPLYGPGSAERFRAHAAGLGVDAVPAVIPNLVDDIDTVDDLRRLSLRAGPRTQTTIARLDLAA